MSDIVELKKHTCQCGWEYPTNLTRVCKTPFVGLVESADVGFECTCPRCGQEHEIVWPQ